jgi:hypothetical protein
MRLWCASLVPTQVCHEATVLRTAGRAAVHDAHRVTDRIRTGDLRGHVPALSPTELQPQCPHQDSNLGPSPCEGDALPLSHTDGVSCSGLGSNQRLPPCRGGALPLSYRNGSRGGIRTRGFRLMRPARTTELLHPARAPPGIRTPNPRIKSPLLCRLSQRRVTCFVRVAGWVRTTGLRLIRAALRPAELRRLGQNVCS